MLNNEERSEFERRTAQLLQQSAQNLDGRTRSRLNQARQRALAELESRQRSPWLSWFDLRNAMPAGAVAAAALVAVVLWTQAPDGGSNLPLAQADAAVAIEDLDLLADSDALDLAQETEGDFEFYEWASSEMDALGS